MGLPRVSWPLDRAGIRSREVRNSWYNVGMETPSSTAPAASSTSARSEILTPKSPHDALSFEQLQSEYNFLNISSYGLVLTNLIVDEIQSRDSGNCNVLDVGCGCGIARNVDYQWAVRDHIATDRGGQYWGIEPDEGIQPKEGLFDQFQHALMETAELPENSIDVAYSSMVMEHVADPKAFLSALERCLKPGGVYLFATPNSRSFVPWMTKVLHQLHLDELVLRLVRAKQEIEEYHYPVQFLFNSPRQIASHAKKHGFDPPGCAFIEGNGSYSYFRGPLKVLKYPLMSKRKLVRRRDRLSTLICRIQKSQ